jgi:hypothetical protein
MKQVVDELMEKIDSEKMVILLDVVRLMTFMLGGAHIIACLWYQVSTLSDSNWINQKEAEHPGLYVKPPHQCDEAVEREKAGVDRNACGRVRQIYIMSLRWAIAQYAGGMDEVTPVNFGEHIYSALIFVFCFWCGAVSMGVLTSSMTNLYLLGSKHSQELIVLRRYLLDNSVSKGLGLRITRNAQHALSERRKTTPETSVDLLRFVSEPLRLELHFEMYKPILAVHPLFAKYIYEAPHVIQNVCHSAMKSTVISKGDVIFNVGEIPKKPQMIIVSTGTLSYAYTYHSRNTQSLITSCGWICEAPLWVNWVHCGTLTACEYTKISTLDAVDFGFIVSSFAHQAVDPYEYAREFYDALADIEPAEVNDLPLEHQLDECKGIPADDPVRMQAASQPTPITRQKRMTMLGSVLQYVVSPPPVSILSPEVASDEAVMAGNSGHGSLPPLLPSAPEDSPSLFMEPELAEIADLTPRRDGKWQLQQIDEDEM